MSKLTQRTLARIELAAAHKENSWTKINRREWHRLFWDKKLYYFSIDRADWKKWASIMSDSEDKFLDEWDDKLEKGDNGLGFYVGKTYYLVGEIGAKVRKIRFPERKSVKDAINKLTGKKPVPRKRARRMEPYSIYD